MAKHTFRGDMQRSQKEKNNGNSLMFQTLPNSFEKIVKPARHRDIEKLMCYTQHIY